MLDCGGLAIAHPRKDGQNPAEAEKYPFGSIFWHNSAQCTWFVKCRDRQRAQLPNVESLDRIVRRQKNVFTKRSRALMASTGLPCLNGEPHEADNLSRQLRTGRVEH